MKPLRIGSPRWERPLIFMTGIYLLGLLISAASKSGVTQPGNPILLLYFVLMTVKIYLDTGSIEMSDETIRYTTPFKPREMRWDEVSRIEVIDCVVLCGTGKTLKLPPIQGMKGADKQRLLELFQAQIQARKIPVLKKGVRAYLYWYTWLPQGTFLRVDFPRRKQVLPLKIAAFAMVLCLLTWLVRTDTRLVTWLIIPSILLFMTACTLLLLRCRLEMNEQFIHFSMPILTARTIIVWKNVESVHLCDTIVGYCRAKKLFLPDLENCEGADKEAMIRLFEAQVAARGIIVTRKRDAK